MTTGIEWTDETWNPVTGCTKVSEGCDNCYAERITNRFGGPGAFDTVVLHPERLDKPLHWRKPRRVFVNSMSDLFHEDVPEAFIAAAFEIMGSSPQHTFQILTKRPGRMASLLNRWSTGEPSYRREDGIIDVNEMPLDADSRYAGEYGRTWPLPNVWLGVSVETQRWADVRIQKLVETPAAVRFLSCEPLLGPITFRWAKWHPWRDSNHLDGLRMLDWVIVGGESGPGARPPELDWVRDIIKECTDAEVACFVKQLGSSFGANHHDMQTWPEDLRIREFPVRRNESSPTPMTHTQTGSER